MLSHDQIFSKIRVILIEMFGFTQEQLRLESLLRDELDLDSIDAINISVELEKVFGKKIEPTELSSVRSLGDLVQAVASLIAVPE